MLFWQCLVGVTFPPTFWWFCSWCSSSGIIWNPWWHGGVSHCQVRFLMIGRELSRSITYILIQTHAPVASCFCSSSLASFIVGAWEKQLFNFATSSLSVSSSQDKTTCCTASADFLKISVLKSLLLALQAWLISLIQSSKTCLFVPSKILMGVNIASFALSLLALVSSWNASYWLLLAGSHHLQGSGLDICQFHQCCT